MATGKLIGADDGGTSHAPSDGYQLLFRFKAAVTGNMTEFKYKGYGNGSIKYAIYSDDGGSPPAPVNRLAQQATAQSVVDGWNTLAISAVPIVKDSYYWLAWVSVSGDGWYSVTSGVYRKHKAATPNFADPFDNTGFSDYDVIQNYIAGWGVPVLSPSSISQPVGYGSPQLNLSIQPSSIVQAIVYGTPIIDTGQIIINPSSIVQVVAIGTPSLRYPQILLPSSIIQAIAYGTPSVVIVGMIMPQSIVQQISIGSPTILKYVWHVILDGQYATETPEKNRKFVIGRDAYGNPVWGEAQDSTEIGLVGERLDFQQELAIPTTTQAADVASAVLSKMRLRGKGGVILIPPNCGQELFDVVQISDAGANQSAVSFRVVGIRFEYNPKQARFEHRLILGAP